jgi:hypothetical protein
MRKRFAVLGATALLFLMSCEKIEENRDTKLRVYLTDQPFQAEAVNIDIQSIKVKYKGTVEDAGSSNPGKSDDWVWLETQSGIYNLLDYKIGKSVLIAAGGVPGGHVKEIRLVLGKTNSIKIDGNTYPMSLPSGSESGFKISFVKQLAIPKDSVTIDFNAALSITQPSPGSFNVIPVLQIK